MLSIDQYRYISLIEQVELENEIFNHFLQEDYLEMNGIQLESSANNIVKSVIVWAKRVLNAIRKLFTNIVNVISSKISEYSFKYNLMNECKKIINEKKDNVTSLTLVTINDFINYDFISKTSKEILLGKESILNVIDFAKGKNEVSQLNKMKTIMHKVYDRIDTYNIDTKYSQLISSSNDLETFFNNCNFIQNDCNAKKNKINKCVATDIYKNAFPSVYDDAIRQYSYSGGDREIPIYEVMFKYITNFKDKTITICDEKSLKYIDDIFKNNKKKMDSYRIIMNKLLKYTGDIDILIDQINKGSEGLDQNLIHIYIQAIDHYVMKDSTMISEFLKITLQVDSYFRGALEQFISINRNDNGDDTIMNSNDETYGYNMDKYIVK